MSFLGSFVLVFEGWILSNELTGGQVESGLGAKCSKTWDGARRGILNVSIPSKLILNCFERELLKSLEWEEVRYTYILNKNRIGLHESTKQIVTYGLKKKNIDFKKQTCFILEVGEKRFCLGSINRDDLSVGRDRETADLCDDHLLGSGQAGFGQGFLFAAVVILGVPVGVVVVLLHEYHRVSVGLDWNQEILVMED